MITVLQLSVSQPFSYLWLKYVHGTDLSVHCAKCLLGEYESRIHTNSPEFSNIRLRPAPYYYLCGVSKPYVWSRNFHLAFREKEGSMLEVKRNGIHIILQNAEEVKFSQTDVDPADPHARHKAYFTCRNWQFAHKLRTLENA